MLGALVDARVLTQRDGAYQPVFSTTRRTTSRLSRTKAVAAFRIRRHAHAGG